MNLRMRGLRHTLQAAMTQNELRSVYTPPHAISSENRMVSDNG